jgi:hypothetical protein
MNVSLGPGRAATISEANGAVDPIRTLTSKRPKRVAVTLNGREKTVMSAARSPPRDRTGVTRQDWTVLSAAVALPPHLRRARGPWFSRRLPDGARVVTARPSTRSQRSHIFFLQSHPDSEVPPAY